MVNDVRKMVSTAFATEQKLTQPDASFFMLKVASLNFSFRSRRKFLAQWRETTASLSTLFVQFIQYIDLGLSNIKFIQYNLSSE